MVKILSDLLESLGICFFRGINRKESDVSLFRDYSGLNQERIQEMYAGMEVFCRCKTYNTPEKVKVKSLSSYVINTYRMASQYTPVSLFQRTYDSFVENKQIYFEEIKKTDSSRKNLCVIYLHGFSERNYENETRYLFFQLIDELPNAEVLSVHLPYHMKRSPLGQPYSGAYIFDSCPVVTIEGIRQAVHDVSQVISYAKENYMKIIVGGFSLGGHITAFLGTCDDRADLYVMGQAGAELPESLRYLTVCPGLVKKQSLWTEKGVDFEKLYSPVELLNYNSIIPPEKVVSVAGIHDRLITFDRVQKLRQFFNCTNNINYPAGHIGFLFEYKKVMKKLISVFKQV